MDTKLKNAEERKEHNWFVKLLLGRKVRAVAFSIACILMAATYLLGMKWFGILQDHSYQHYSGDRFGLVETNYAQTYDYQYSRLEFYEALCITSSFYLRNTDDNGNFTLSNSAFVQFAQEMKNVYGLEIKKDSEGRVYAESDEWDFFVAFGDKYLTNMDYDFKNSQLDLLMFEDDFKKEYTYYNIRTANTISCDYELKNAFPYSSADTVIYGEFLSRRDWDEEYFNGDSLPIGRSGYDNLGRYIFQYFGDREIIYYDFSKKSNKLSVLPDYDVKNHAFYLERENGDFTLFTDDDREIKGYEANYYDDTEISVFFAPAPEKYAEIVGGLSIVNREVRTVLPGFITCALLLACCCVYLAVVCGYDSKHMYKWRQTVVFGRWYTDIILVLLALGIFALITVTLDGHEWAEDYLGRTDSTMTGIISCIVALIFAICGGLSLAVVAKFKTKTFIGDSLIYRWLRRFINFIRTKIIDTKLFTLYHQKTIGQKLYTISWIFAIWTVFTLMLWVVWFVFAVVYYHTMVRIIILLLTFVYLVYAVWFVVTLLKGFSDIHKLSGQIEQVSKGEAVSDDIHQLSLAYTDSRRLQHLSENIKETVEKQIQSERMKIELVTNVSHDLKTPLTSIISYIDLLKKEELPEEAMDYVKILDAKSMKLKDIVSDVFSLAKATSGIDVDMKEIDGVVLLNQVLADNQDKIEKSGKTVVTDISCDSALINADGNKLYRVFQNLIDNALCYSLDGTRIFISLIRQGSKMIFQVKNTASYEMKFTPDEIMERFTRGDKSRTDGGNGLGLSIAKTFTEACGGSFRIVLDGDVFIAFVEMPLKD